MDNKQLIEAICDELENVTQSARTRKTSEKSKTKSDVYKHANEAGDLFYKYEQITATHRLDCDSLREAPNALELIVGGVVSTAVIDDQKIGRVLSVSAFAEKYNAVDGVIIDLKSALSKKVKEVSPDTVKKQFNRLSKEQQITLLREQAKIAGIDFPETE